MKIRMKGKHISITIIHCYALTNDSKEESKDAFYDQLQADVGSFHHLVAATLKLELRRNGPRKARQQHFDLKKLKEPRAKRMTRADMRVYIEDVARKGEEAANRGEQGQVQQGITRTGVQDHQARQKQVTAEPPTRRLWITEKATNHGSRVGGKIGRPFQQSSDQTTSFNYNRSTGTLN